MLYPYIKKIEIMTSYTILIEYDTGEKRIFEAADFLEGEIFEPLKDMDFFNRAKISFNTVEWPNGADFSPEFLWENSLPV